MNTRIQQHIIPAVLSFLLATTAPLAAGGTGTFSRTGSMNFPRTNHKTILLDNGLVLAVTGGFTTSGTAAPAELYNPETGTWTLTGSTAALHENGSATLLANGEVLLAGHADVSEAGTLEFNAVAELYNPSTGQWSTTGSMTDARAYQAAVLLSNGEVLVVGGEDSSLNSIASAEIYNPATGTWQATASMHASRRLPFAQLLGDGTVLVAGGAHVTTNGPPFVSALNSAEIYNPSTGEWTSTENFPLPSLPGSGSFGGSGFPPFGVGALLPNGDVLVAREAFFDPGTGTWTGTGPFPNSRIITGPGTATLLTTGNVLMTGFRSTYNRVPPESMTVLYDPSSNTNVFGPYMTTSRSGDAATLLPNGQVLVSGGNGGSYYAPPQSSAELYTP